VVAEADSTQPSAVHRATHAGTLGKSSLQAPVQDGAVPPVGNWAYIRTLRKIVWRYGHSGHRMKSAGYLNTPDGVDFIPLAKNGLPNPAAIRHGR
jgi:hypothetical protein